MKVNTFRQCALTTCHRRFAAVGKTVKKVFCSKACVRKAWKHRHPDRVKAAGKKYRQIHANKLTQQHRLKQRLIREHKRCKWCKWCEGPLTVTMYRDKHGVLKIGTTKAFCSHWCYTSYSRHNQTINKRRSREQPEQKRVRAAYVKRYRQEHRDHLNNLTWIRDTTKRMGSDFYSLPPGVQEMLQLRRKFYQAVSKNIRMI